MTDTKFPREILDLIYLHLDYKTLEQSREIQSEYVKKITQYETMYEAAKNENLSMLRWLKENCCPWDSGTFVAAKENGNAEILCWLKEHGCPEADWSYSHEEEEEEDEDEDEDDDESVGFLEE